MCRWLPNGFHRTAALCGLLATVVLLGGGHRGLALEPSTPLANYGRQTWVMENGLPQNTVQALVQTRDGFVWLGTEVGLVRFDGNGFQVFDRNSTPALPGNDVHCLLESRDGALWIGTSEGLVRWKDGAVTAFTTKDGLLGSQILALGEMNGVLWVWTDASQAELAGDRFISYTTIEGLAGMAMPSVARITEVGVLPMQLLPDGERVFVGKSTLEMTRGVHVVKRYDTGHDLPGSRVQGGSGRQVRGRRDEIGAARFQDVDLLGGQRARNVLDHAVHGFTGQFFRQLNLLELGGHIHVDLVFLL